MPLFRNPGTALTFDWHLWSYTDHESERHSSLNFQWGHNITWSCRVSLLHLKVRTRLGLFKASTLLPIYQNIPAGLNE